MGVFPVPSASLMALEVKWLVETMTPKLLKPRLPLKFATSFLPTECFHLLT